MAAMGAYFISCAARRENRQGLSTGRVGNSSHLAEAVYAANRFVVEFGDAALANSRQCHYDGAPRPPDGRGDFLR